MSKIKLILAIVLVAFTLCLSACGEGNDAAATPSQTGAKQSSSQTQETSSTDDTSPEGSAVSSQQDNGGEQPDDQTGNGDEAGSQNDGDADTDSRTSQDDDPQDEKPELVRPTAAISDDPGERDNAEVNINDL